MNQIPVNEPPLKMAAGQVWVAEPKREDWPDGPKRRAGWSPARWLTVIALVFAAHIALIFLFGEKKETVPRPVTNVPTLTLANDSNELLALDDPTLFALPHQRDFASVAWLKTKDVKPPLFRYSELPQPLPFSTAGLGAAFGQFMQTNLVASQPFDFKPVVELSTPTPPFEPAPAQNSTMQIEGDLAQRQLPASISLTNWPFADVLAPGVVQVLVDPAGNVVSTVLLKPSGYDAADQRALELARALRFTPSSRLAFGRVVFNWQTVPPIESP